MGVYGMGRWHKVVPVLYCGRSVADLIAGGWQRLKWDRCDRELRSERDHLHFPLTLGQHTITCLYQSQNQRQEGHGTCHELAGVYISLESSVLHSNFGLRKSS